MCWFYFLIENQCISLQICKDLGVGGWGLDNPYDVRILNPLEIIGRSLTGGKPIWRKQLKIDKNIKSKVMGGGPYL